MTNRLARESSPYLLQHADNPVDWFPWGPEALEMAREQDKPILLSIGYSACHWCHVMAHESFEDPAIAALMNELFVNIKVDREERPDLDSLYMMAVQMMTGHGGWPMTVFLTPEGKPFFVYLPTNAPHSPYLVADEYREPYAQQGLEDKDARIYGMIANIDDNVGRLLQHLDQKGLAENTIFIFMTDNGPTTRLYNAGLRDQKASSYEGGIRAPFFLRWPAKLQPKISAACVDQRFTRSSASSSTTASGVFSMWEAISSSARPSASCVRLSSFTSSAQEKMPTTSPEASRHGARLTDIQCVRPSAWRVLRSYCTRSPPSASTTSCD